MGKVQKKIIVGAQVRPYSASGYYAIQFSSSPSPIIAFSFEDVPHSRRKCCICVPHSNQNRYIYELDDFSCLAFLINSM